MFASWLALVLTAALVEVLMWRIGDKEKLLLGKFGARWEDYCSGMWRIVP